MKLTEIQEYFESSLYEMSNFRSDTTGLTSGTKLWVREEPTELPHTKYRVKFDHPQNGSAVFALWGDEPIQVAGDWEVSGKDLKKIVALINALHNEIRGHIDGVVDSAELGVALQQIRPDIEEI